MPRRRVAHALDEGVDEALLAPARRNVVEAHDRQRARLLVRALARLSDHDAPQLPPATRATRADRESMQLCAGDGMGGRAAAACMHPSWAGGFFHSTR